MKYFVVTFQGQNGERRQVLSQSRCLIFVVRYEPLNRIATGVQLSWESTCFASRGSSVRSRLSPPMGEMNRANLDLTWAYSSAGQSVRLISGRSMVRVHLSPPILFIASSLMHACIEIQCCASLLALNKITFVFSASLNTKCYRTLKTEQSMQDKREIGHCDNRL